MTDQPPPTATRLPETLIEGAYETAAKMLDVASLEDNFALSRVARFDGVALVDAICGIIASNYVRGGATVNKNRSGRNWRLPRLQTSISPINGRAEIRVERAIAKACAQLGRADWANQMPTASGLLGNKEGKHRCIDLVHQLGPRHFELIELKIKSNTPLYAAVQIVIYGCLWLIAHNDRPAYPSPLLDSDRIDLRVLAPSTYYRHLAAIFKPFEVALDAGVHALGQRNGVALSFAFDLLDERIRSDDIPDAVTLLALLDNRQSASAAEPTP